MSLFSRLFVWVHNVSKSSSKELLLKSNFLPILAGCIREMKQLKKRGQMVLYTPIPPGWKGDRQKFLLLLNNCVLKLADFNFAISLFFIYSTQSREEKRASQLQYFFFTLLPTEAPMAWEKKSISGNGQV